MIVLRSSVAIATIPSTLGMMIACATPGPTRDLSGQRTPTKIPVSTPGGRLIVYSALNETTNSAFKIAFEREHPGITLEFYTLAASGDLQAHIRSEHEAPKADVFLGGSSEFHDPLGLEGILEPYHSPKAADIDSGFKDPRGRWTGWYLGIF